MVAFEQIISEMWWLGIPTALFAGALLALNPLALPMLGTAFALATTGEAATKGAGVRMTAAFGAGMVVVYTAVGVVASQVDRVTNTFLRPYSGIGYVLIGLVLIGLGAFLLVRQRSFCSACALPARKSPTLLGAFLAGIPGGFVNCPACAGIVLGIAAASATVGSPAYSASVMFSLGAGHAMMLTGLMWWAVGKRAISASAPFLRFLRPFGAILLLAVGGYFLWLARVNGLDPTVARLP